MRNILVAILTLLGATVASADTCAVNLMPAFVDSQARKLCSTFGSLSTNLLPSQNDVYDVGSINYLWDQIWTTQLITMSFANSATANSQNFYKTRSTTSNGNVIVQSLDDIGSIQFLGANGTGYDVASIITGYVGGTPGASGDMPGGIAFKTSPDGSATPVTRWSVNASGSLQQNNVSGGNIAINVAGTGLDASGSGGPLLLRSGTGGINFQNSSSNNVWNLSDTGNLVSNATNGGDLTLSVAGKKLTVKGGGAAATSGQFTCNGTTGVVVATTSASTGMVLAFSPVSISGTAPIGAPYVSALTAATSFTVKCSVAGETSVYNWAMIGVN